jgi:hypothetical protein
MTPQISSSLDNESYVQVEVEELCVVLVSILKRILTDAD